MEWGWALGLIPYGDRWRALRKTFHRFFHVNAVQQYHGVETREVRAFLQRAMHLADDVDALARSVGQ